VGAWGVGNFESDDGEGWLQLACQPILDQVRATLANGSRLQDDIGEGLVPARLQLLAATWEEANRANRGLLDTPSRSRPHASCERGGGRIWLRGSRGHRTGGRPPEMSRPADAWLKQASTGC